MNSKQKETILILGGDGYLGWSLGLAFARRTDLEVVLVDSLIKRAWEKEVGARPLVPYDEPAERIREYERIFGKKNMSFVKLDLMNKGGIVDLIKKYKPFAIINAAQQPSAPFSMMSAENAGVTFSNNIVGHLNVIWAIAETDKNIKYIKLGSAGCYMSVDSENLPLNRVDLTFEDKGKTFKILNSWIPMHASDMYHVSKISDFLISDLCASMWGVRTATIQQATIFGATIEENRSIENHGLSTRFNYDDIFSTVLNRFACEIAIGHPITVYGDGEQKTGLISLSDTVNNFMKLAFMDIAPGEHVIVHNYTTRLSIKEIAEMLVAIDCDCQSSVEYIRNPRKEYKGALNREVEVHDIMKSLHEKKEEKLKRELTEFLNFTKLYKDNIDSSIIMPKVLWEKVNVE